MPADPRIAKANKLLALLKENKDKEDAILEELLAVLGGGETIGEKIKRVKAAFDSRWCEAMGVSEGGYAWNHLIDSAHIKRLLKIAPATEVIGRIGAFFENPDAFTISRQYTFGTFVARFNQLAGMVPRDEDDETPDLVFGCAHTPPCRSTDQHSARTREDLRR